jgi:hypothetical protein
MVGFDSRGGMTSMRAEFSSDIHYQMCGEGKRAHHTEDRALPGTLRLRLRPDRMW